MCLDGLNTYVKSVLIVQTYFIFEGNVCVPLFEQSSVALYEFVIRIDNLAFI